MPNGENGRLPHLVLTVPPETRPYTSPSSGRSRVFGTPARDRQAHAQALVSQFDTLRTRQETRSEEQRALGWALQNGIYLTFESDEGFELKFESLEARTSGIELCNVKPEGERQLATVFVPEGKLDILLNKVIAYSDTTRDSTRGKPRNKELVESIRAVSEAALRSLWTDPDELFPESGDTVWWEVWLRVSRSIDHEQFLRVHAEQIGMRVHQEVVRFLDPGQAWNAITVGAYTEKTEIDAAEFPGWTAVAPCGDLSPSSCTSTAWIEKQWPIKPDVVMEGGNMAFDPETGHAFDIDSLKIVSTGHQPQTRLLVPFGDTSGSSAQVARLAAQVLAQYPNFWPETVRALIVHSARWTDAMKQQFAPLRSQQEKRNLLRWCGYGVPDEESLFWSAQDALTLIAEATLQPLHKDGSTVKTREIHVHRLPWPVEVLRELGDAPVEMRVTLSYFVEPNPGERGWIKKFRYQSHGLRFSVKRSLESLDEFQQRLNKQARDEEDDYPGAVAETGEWYLGTRLWTLGSVHSDVWSGTASELADRGHVAVYPVLGWWKERPALERWGNNARYAIVITIRTPEIEADIYTPVMNEIAAQIAV